MEMKKEEIAFRREQLSMEEKRIEAEQKRQAQMQEQFLIQQRQLQQQMQAQAQSQALLMTLLAKMNKYNFSRCYCKIVLCWYVDSLACRLRNYAK